MLRHAAAGLAHDARPVRVVDEHHGLVLARELDDLGQPREVSLHGEDPVGDDELPLPRLARSEPVAKLVHRRVLVDHLARGSREPDGVDDRGVVELVREDDGVLVGERRDGCLVRVPAGDVGQRRLRADEVGELALELVVDLERPADEAHRARARPVAAEPLDPRLDHLRSRCEPEVVVRREDEHPASALHLHHGPLRREQGVEALVRPGLAQRVELGGDRLVELLARDGGHQCATSATSACLCSPGLPPG